jgi:hypothetical protein
MAVTAWARGKLTNRWKDSKKIGGVLTICTFWSVVGCRMLKFRNRFIGVSVTIEESALLKLYQN